VGRKKLVKPNDTNKIVCVNLGCGNYIAHSHEKDQVWFNLDRYAHNDGVQMVADLEEGLPFKNESVDFLYASHVFEHVRKFPELMQECHRVLKPRGCLSLKVPLGGCRASFADPTHYWQFAPETWYHFDKDSNIGFDTLGMRRMGFILKWNEVVRHRRNGLDGDKPGDFFTEIIVDYEKDGPFHKWEKKLMQVVKEQQCQKEIRG